MLYNINASVALYRELAKESYAAQKPEPLPKLRFRELSPLSRSTGRAKRTGTANESDSPQTCFQKPQNLLVDHLPPEIRLRVWKYAVGGQTLHILRKMAKVGHRVCRGQNCPDCAQCDFALSIDTSGIAEPFTETYKSTEASLLSLLLTCHQIYSEAVEILYSSNTFHFPHIWNLSFFQSTILPKRFSAIRSVTLVHYFEPFQYDDPVRFVNPFTVYPGPEASWKSGCDALLAMTSLRKLEIHVRKPQFYPANLSSCGIVGVFEELKGLEVREWKVYVMTGSPDWNVDVGVMETELRKRGLGIKVIGKPLEHDPKPAM